MGGTFYEFFAGGGMARAGLGADWRCLFANDFNTVKAATYAANWGDEHLLCEDVAKVKLSDLPEVADMVWASFPCQDLSLAGSYRGLGSVTSKVMTRSGTFWPFWNLMQSLSEHHRRPRMIVLENVVGALTSRNGHDFAAICEALNNAAYRFGTLVIDARYFLPQSRQRVFFIAIAPEIEIPDNLFSRQPSQIWHTPALVAAYESLSFELKQNWLWWHLPNPPMRTSVFADVIDDEPQGCNWHSPEETTRLLSMMTQLHLEKVEIAKRAKQKLIGAVYKRTRIENGIKRQRAEVRFDDLAGCLRTPGGGSSRQTIIVVAGQNVRSRLLSPREAARLMGLDEDYKIPIKYNDAYQLAGDGVCVPVVRHLAQFLLEPILCHNPKNDNLIAA